MIFTYDQPRMETLPRSQLTICRNSSPVKAIIKEIRAPRNELKMIPVKIIVSTFIARSTLRAKASTKKIVKNENRILNTGRVNAPMRGSDICKKIVNTAPTDAPEETPACTGPPTDCGAALGTPPPLWPGKRRQARPIPPSADGYSIRCWHASGPPRPS